VTERRRRELAAALSGAERRLAAALGSIAGARRRVDEAAAEQDRAETEAQLLKVEIEELRRELRGQG
jgi:hypothetical protein